MACVFVSKCVCVLQCKHIRSAYPFLFWRWTRNESGTSKWIVRSELLLCLLKRDISQMWETTIYLIILTISPFDRRILRMHLREECVRGCVSCGNTFSICGHTNEAPILLTTTRVSHTTVDNYLQQRLCSRYEYMHVSTYLRMLILFRVTL